MSDKPVSLGTTKPPARHTLEYHLEMVIWEDAAEGTRMNAPDVYSRMAAATDEQKARAAARLGRAINGR